MEASGNEADTDYTANTIFMFTLWELMVSNANGF